MGRAAVLLQPSLVAPEALLDALGGGVEALIGVLVPALALENDAGVEVDRAIAAEAGALALDGDVGVVAAVDIFADAERHALFNATPQGLANIDALA